MVQRTKCLCSVARRRGTLQEFERFVVAAALKIMRQLRIDWAWQCCLQVIDLFRNGAQPCHMRFCIAPAFFIVNNREAFS